MTFPSFMNCGTWLAASALLACTPSYPSEASGQTGASTAAPARSADPTEAPRVRTSSAGSRISLPQAHARPQRSADTDGQPANGKPANGSSKATSSKPINDAATAEEPAWPPAPPELSSKWCSGPVHTLDEQNCYALPDAPTDALLIYFHGLVPPSLESPQKDNLFEVVLNASKRAGVAVLLPLGEPELAPEGKFKGWYGWPTRGSTYASHAATLIERTGEARRALEAHVKRPFQRIYIAGSSSGAYFVAALALRGDLEAEGYGAFSGGSARLIPKEPAAPRRPFYVGYGSYDGAKASAVQLVAALEGLGWPVQAAEHKTGHGAREVYLDEAFAYWRSAVRAKDQFSAAAEPSD